LKLERTKRLAMIWTSQLKSGEFYLLFLALLEISRHSMSENESDIKVRSSPNRFDPIFDFGKAYYTRKEAGGEPNANPFISL
jgi:hypothetical protein